MKPLPSSLAFGTTVHVASMHAQNASQPGPFPAVPPTKILAVGRITGATTADARNIIMLNEVSDTVRLYLSGKIDQWYVRKDQNGWCSVSVRPRPS